MHNEPAHEAVGGTPTMLASMAQEPDADRIMRKAVADGARFVILGSFGYVNGGLRLTRRYPDVSILHASDHQVAPNFAPFAAKYLQGTFLMGMAAAALSQTGRLGSVSAFAIPELITSVNAFALGARAVSPEAEVAAVWVSSWFDPAQEREAAQALISQGVDAIFSNALRVLRPASCPPQGAPVALAPCGGHHGRGGGGAHDGGGGSRLRAAPGAFRCLSSSGASARPSGWRSSRRSWRWP